LQRSELETVYARLLVENDRRQIEERAARQKVEGARLVLQQEQLALRQSERQVQWHRDQRNLLQDQVEIAEKEIERIRNGLVMLASQVETDREQLRTDNHALAALLLDEFQYQVAQWETHLAVAERGLADENRRMEERKQAKERSIRLKASINHRMDDLIAGQTALEEQKRSMFDEEAVFSRALVDIQERIEPGNSQVQTLEIEQARLEELLAAARQSVSLADHHHAQTRIVLARAQENLSSLQRRIEEDFGLVAFEYAEQVSGQSPLPFDGMVEQLPRVFKLSPEIDEAIKRQRAQMRRIGPINPEALAEYQAVQERYTFMQEQVNDLKQAEMDIHEVIHELDVLMQQNFSKTFNAVAAEFKTIFQRLFDGGSARLVLTEPDNITDTGIDIEARLPGRRNQGLSLLSGGERSLTATSLVFALMKVSPTPFCVLDEVDAMLDEANVGRFRELLRELSQQTQFVIVTHNRNTVQAAEVIYGVTMGKDSASQVVSLKMDQIQQVLE
jgi:chromosome segregation protein